MKNVLDILRERGLVEAITATTLEQRLREPIVVYAGFDPSSDSLQIGNFVTIMTLAHFQRQGHRVLAVAGGATGMIGDPSGKSAERNFLSAAQVEENLAGIRENLSRFLDFEHPTAPARILNNNDWLRKFTVVDFLREAGRHFRMGSMLGRESVRARLNSENGMSYAEFSYQALQAYDFLHLYDACQCQLQIGGSDQWGNITAGIELIRRLRGVETFGLTFPLISDSAGRKFGKSEGNAVFLDARRTSPYAFYQFFLRVDDADVDRLLKVFTFLPLEEIETLKEKTAESPEQRLAQRRLAGDVTRMVHGESGLRQAQTATEALFGGTLAGLSAGDLGAVFADAPSATLPADTIVNRDVVSVAVAAGLCGGKGAARRLIAGGGLYLNNRRVENEQAVVSATDIIDGRMLVLRAGKKNYRLVQLH